MKEWTDYEKWIFAAGMVAGISLFGIICIIINLIYHG